jgi:hypothetical protein
MKPVYSDIDGIAAWASMLALAGKARAKFDALPKSEQEGILKNNDYKRVWHCPTCDINLSL